MSFIPSSTWTSQLILKDAFFIHVCAASLAHYALRRWDTTNPWAILSVLCLPSLFLSQLFLSHAASVFIAVATSYSVFLGTLITSVVLYRISPFHPLANYPGPLLCKVSKAYTVWKIRDGKQHLYFQGLHDIYGDVVRIGPNELCFRDPAMISGMMGTNGLPRGPARISSGMWPKICALIMIRNHDEHARRRRPWTRAFSTSALKEYEPIIARRVTQFVDGLAAEKGATNLTAWICWFTYDFMTDMVFGGGSEMMSNHEEDDFWHMLKRGFERTVIYEHLPWLPRMLMLLPGGASTVLKMRSVGVVRAKARIDRGSNSRDLFYYLSNEDGAEKVDPEKPVLIAEGFSAMVAGSDTTVSALTAVFWCLLHHPDKYDRLREEVDKYYPRGEDSTRTEFHSKMVYLDAVLNETLRLFPAGPSGSQRATPNGEGDRLIGGRHIPEGTHIRVHTWSMQRDARNFSHPDKFWPERWLIAENLAPLPVSAEFTHNPDAFIPFSFGPYNCVGKNLALQEMKVLICHTMQRLEMRFAEGWDPLDWEENIKDKFIIEVGKVPVISKVRN